MKRGRIRISNAEPESRFDIDDLWDLLAFLFYYVGGTLVVLFMLVAAIYALISAPTPPTKPRTWAFCSDDSNPNCLPPAPERPRWMVAVTFQDEKHPSVQTAFVVQTASSIQSEGIVIGAPHVLIHAVDHVPMWVLNARDARAGMGGGFSLFNHEGPLVFQGDVNIDVGPLAERDQLVTSLALRQSQIREIETVYIPTRVRGPPSSSYPPSYVSVPFPDLESVLEIFVVGKVREYSLPEQSGRSTHHASILDIDLTPTKQEDLRYGKELSSWRSKLAEKIGIPKETFKDVKNEHDLRTIEINNGVIRGLAPRRAGRSAAR